jgi:hypothetical protein
MKKQLLLGSTLFFGCILTIVSCKKDPVPITEKVNTINSLFQELKSTPQTFTVAAGTQQTITGARGTKITFNPQSFKNVGGNTITAGSIKIELIEMYKPGEMITNRVTTTTASNMLLTSGGSVNIKATLNDHEVLANNYKIAFKQPAASESPMALFTGYTTTDGTGTSVRWSDDTTGTVPRTVKDPSDQAFYYIFDSCTNFNWVNCDYFYNAPSPKTDITIVAPSDNSYNMDNTRVFVIFPATNTVVNMYNYSTTTHSFSFGYPSFYLPIGTQVHIMILGSKNNNYFMDLHQNVTVTNGLSVNFTPVNQTLSYIQSTLSSL